MKTISGALQTHIEGELTTLCDLIKLVLTDGTIYGFTNHDRSLTVNIDGLGNVLYTPALSFNPSALDTKAGLGNDNRDIEAVLDSAEITDADLLSGRFNFASFKSCKINWADITQGVMKMHRGNIGEITIGRDSYKAQFNSLSSLYKQPIGELYTADCRADLGDSRCKVSIAPQLWTASTLYGLGTIAKATGGALPLLNFICVAPSTSGLTEPVWNETLGGETLDSFVTWNTIIAREVICTVATVATPIYGSPHVHTFTVTPDLAAFVAIPVNGSSYFFGGKVTWISGANVGVGMEVKAFDPTTNTITLWLSPRVPIVVTDMLKLTVGCDKLRTTCRDKFKNIINMRAEPFTPGLDKALSYPDAPAA